MQSNAQMFVDRIREQMADVESVRLMEICGTHTVSIFRSGIKSLLPNNLKLISGPGCPVCVTAQGYIDAACDLATRPNLMVCTYGDMVRVPGRRGSLAEARARGGRVKTVYSAHDALQHAKAHPDETVVFLAVGFETTTPPTAITVLEADKAGVENFFVLLGHKLVIPAMMALLSGGEVPVDGFLCPGHVSVIIGADAYTPIVDQYEKPCVVAGFEPEGMLAGISKLVELVQGDQGGLENAYKTAVGDAGNPHAQAIIDRVFEPVDVAWRAMGVIPQSGLGFRKPYQRFDALQRFDLDLEEDYDPPGCRCGEVIQGKVEPNECPLFDTVCTPGKPVGPCMVSSEGTCAAWHKYALHQ